MSQRRRNTQSHNAKVNFQGNTVKSEAQTNDIENTPKRHKFTNSSAFNFNKKIEIQKVNISIFIAAIALLSVIVSQYGTYKTIEASQYGTNKTIEAMQRANDIKYNEIIENTAQGDREYRYQVACFVFEHYDYIYGDDAEKRQNIINVMTVTFPYEICRELFINLKNISISIPASEAFSDAQIKLDQIHAAQAASYTIGDNVRVTIQYQNNKDKSIVIQLNNLLIDKGYSVFGDVQKTDENIGGEIRYFFEEDQNDAEKVKESVNDYMTSISVPCDMNVVFMGHADNSAKQGLIEIWIPSLS